MTSEPITTGPWEVMPIRLWLGHAEAYDIVYGSDNQILVNDVASEADARLIAAAPELLRAAKLAYEYAQFHTSDCDSVKAALFDFDATADCSCFLSALVAAIAKAEGNS